MNRKHLRNGVIEKELLIGMMTAINSAVANVRSIGTGSGLLRASTMDRLIALEHGVLWSLFEELSVIGFEYYPGFKFPGFADGVTQS